MNKNLPPLSLQSPRHRPDPTKPILSLHRNTSFKGWWVVRWVDAAGEFQCEAGPSPAEAFTAARETHTSTTPMEVP